MTNGIVPQLQQPDSDQPQAMQQPQQSRLRNMLNGFASSLLHQGGVMTPEEMQLAQQKLAIEHMHAQAAQTQAQGLNAFRQMQANEYAPSPAGFATQAGHPELEGAPWKNLASVIAQERRGVGAANVAAENKKNPVTDALKAAYSAYSSGDMDEYKKQLSFVTSANEAQGKTAKVTSAQEDSRWLSLRQKELSGQQLTPDETTWKKAFEDRVDVKTTNPRLKSLTAMAYARAKANAQYRDVTVPEYGEDGEPTGRYRTTNALDAMISGTPTVGKPNMMQVAQKQALIKDMGGALENVRQSGSRIDWSAANKPSLIAALGDSTTGPGEFMRSEVARRLTPEERQYVVDVKVAQEALQSLRPILGAGQGSDLQRKLGLATNPGAQTPDYDYLNRQVDGLQGMLKRVSPGTTSLAKPGGPGAPSAGQTLMREKASGRTGFIANDKVSAAVASGRYEKVTGNAR